MANPSFQLRLHPPFEASPRHNDRVGIDGVTAIERWLSLYQWRDEFGRILKSPESNRQ